MPNSDHISGDHPIKNPVPGSVKYHTREDDKGILHKCYHECKHAIMDWKFLLGITISWPLEHWAWQNLPLFRDISHWLGLH